MFRLKELRTAKKISQLKLAERIGMSRSTIAMWESGASQPDNETLNRLADFFDVSLDYLLGRTDVNIPAAPFPFENEDVVFYEVIGSVAAGYDGKAIENHTGEKVPIPTSFLKGRKKDEFFVLKIKGNSMYPKLIDGDLVLVKRCSVVDSGAVAVVLYNGDDATVKKVRYVPGENWLELIPQNPEYMTKRIEGKNMENLRILGQVIKLIRDI